MEKLITYTPQTLPKSNYVLAEEEGVTYKMDKSLLKFAQANELSSVPLVNWAIWISLENKHQPAIVCLSISSREEIGKAEITRPFFSQPLSKSEEWLATKKIGLFNIDMNYLNERLDILYMGDKENNPNGSGYYFLSTFWDEENLDTHNKRAFFAEIKPLTELSLEYFPTLKTSYPSRQASSQGITQKSGIAGIRLVRQKIIEVDALKASGVLITNGQIHALLKDCDGYIRGWANPLTFQALKKAKYFASRDLSRARPLLYEAAGSTLLLWANSPSQDIRDAIKLIKQRFLSKNALEF